MTSPAIQWYPGHIAKAERALAEQLKRVDVILEVRDARIPLATHHPRIYHWIGNRERVLVLNRMDMISDGVREQWHQWFETKGERVYFIDAKHGKGIEAIAKATQTAGTTMNQRRRDRGMKPRPVRAVVLGFPNVGKSALINRLLKRRVVESARRAGVTRQLRWVRLSDQLELLDAPGVLPAQLKDQTAALKLAICDDIGEAAYDHQRVAAAFVDLLKQVEILPGNPRLTELLRDRYNVDPKSITGEAFVHQMAAVTHKNNVDRAARQLLTDFRRGILGNLALDLPPSINGYSS
ncbi:MAG: ribosome biogenesis GTPase YlqF [Cyanobacteria bacterium P01_A01_bin.123]